MDLTLPQAKKVLSLLILASLKDDPDGDWIYKLMMELYSRIQDAEKLDVGVELMLKINH